MAAWIGKNFNTALQWGSESVWATEVATTNAIGKVTNFTPIINNNMVTATGVGDGRNASIVIWGNFDCGGSINYEVHDFEFLKHWVGPYSGAGTSGDKYTLTESSIIGQTAATDILSFSLEVGDEEGATDDVITYVGCNGNDFTLSGGIGIPVTCAANFSAKTFVPSATATAYTATTTAPWQGYQSTYKYGTTPTSIVKVQTWSVSLNNNNFSYRDGSRFIEKPEPGLRIYGWTMTVIATDAQKTALENSCYGGSSGPVTGVTGAEYTADEELHILMAEGTGGGNRQAEIKLDDCWINNITRDVILGNDLRLLTVTGGAKSSHTSKFVEWWTN